VPVNIDASAARNFGCGTCTMSCGPACRSWGVATSSTAGVWSTTVQEAEQEAWISALHQAWPFLPENAQEFWTELGMGPKAPPPDRYHPIGSQVPTKP
jgi:hypothetical protein